MWENMEKLAVIGSKSSIISSSLLNGVVNNPFFQIHGAAALYYLLYHNSMTHQSRVTTSHALTFNTVVVGVVVTEVVGEFTAYDALLEVTLYAFLVLTAELFDDEHTALRGHLT